MYWTKKLTLVSKMSQTNCTLLYQIPSLMGKFDGKNCSVKIWTDLKPQSNLKSVLDESCILRSIFSIPITSSSHVFTNSKSTNIRTFFTKFSYLSFLSLFKGCKVSLFDYINSYISPVHLFLENDLIQS